MKELGVPIRFWVPDWLGFCCIFIVTLPVTALNGSYTGGMLEILSTPGANSEDITVGYYAASTGMAIVYPIISKVLAAVSVKLLLLIDLFLRFFLSWICARSRNVDILTVCSFAIGFLEGFLMLWSIRYTQKILSVKNIRSEFYSYLYPLVHGGGQASMLVTAQLTYHYNWKYMYYFMVLLILASVLSVIVCFRHNRPTKSVPSSDLHIREILIISVGLLMLICVVNYRKVLDWMASVKLCAYIVISPILIALFIRIQHRSKNSYVSLAPLPQSKAVIGYFYMMLIVFFSTFTTLLTNYLSIILKVDSTYTYSLYTFLFPGYVIGAFICFWWLRWQHWRFRFLIAGGMSCFVIFFDILYFGIASDSTYEMLYLPIFFRGLGMLTLIIAFALFAIEGLDPEFLLSSAFFLTIFRLVLAPIMATSFYSNTLYRLQQKYMYSLSETITTVDPLAASRYTQSPSNALAQGHRYDETVRIATHFLYGTLQEQSLSFALKEILGYLLVISTIIAAISRFIPFHKTIRVILAKTGDDMVQHIKKSKSSQLFNSFPYVWLVITGEQILSGVGQIQF